MKTTFFDRLSKAIATFKEAGEYPVEFIVPWEGDGSKIPRFVAEDKGRINDRPTAGADRGRLKLEGFSRVLTCSYHLNGERQVLTEKVDIRFSLLDRSWNTTVTPDGYIMPFTQTPLAEADFTPLFTFVEPTPSIQADCLPEFLRMIAESPPLRARQPDPFRDDEPPTQSWRDRPPLL